MTPSQKYQVRSSEIRQELNDLQNKETLTDEERAKIDELTTEYRDVESKLRAAIVTESDEEKRELENGDQTVDAETRERRELRDKCSLGRYLKAAMSGKEPNGVELEYRQAEEVDGIPISMFDREPEQEQRVDALTGQPGTVGLNIQPLQPMLFAQSIAPRMGIEMPRVESGTYVTGTLTTALTAEAKGAGDAAESTAAAFTMQSVTPKRVSARLGLRIEDLASVGIGNFESILRENLSLVMSDALDNEMINGDGTGDNLNGLFKRLTDPSAPSTVAKFDDFLAAFADGIDGLWASVMKDLTAVVGPDTYKLAAKSFRDGSTTYRGDIAFSDYAMEHTGGFWTNKRMPAVASDVQQGILHRKGRMIRTAVCPHWNEIAIDDIYSGSAKGERFLTFHVLLGDVTLVQPGAYQQIAFKVSS